MHDVSKPIAIFLTWIHNLLHKKTKLEPRYVRRCIDESPKWRYDPFGMYVSILSNILCIHLRKKAVSPEICVSSEMYVFFRQWEKLILLCDMLHVLGVQKGRLSYEGPSVNTWNSIPFVSIQVCTGLYRVNKHRPKITAQVLLETWNAKFNQACKGVSETKRAHELKYQNFRRLDTELKTVFPITIQGYSHIFE